MTVSRYRKIQPGALLCVAALVTAPTMITAQVRDSAGLSIVSIPRSVALRNAPLVFSATPSFVIGENPPSAQYEFADVAGAARLSDGTVIIVNRATNELRWFDASGLFLHAAGRHGKGPGEFTNIAAFVLLPNDTVLVQDWSTSRVAAFSKRGDLVGTFTMGPPPQRPRSALVGAFRDNSLLGAGSDYLTDTEPPPGLFTLTQTLFHFAADGTPIRALNTMVERQFLFVADARGNARYVQPFGLVGTVRIAGDRYLTGDGKTFEIREFTKAGRLVRVIRADILPHRITDADKAAEKKRILTFYGQTSTSPAFERFWDAVSWPDQLPAFKRFEISDDGTLWVELYTGASEPPRWLIFDAERRVLGQITQPAPFEIRQIRRDGVVGVRRDADDVEQVVYYPLARR